MRHGRDLILLLLLAAATASCKQHEAAFRRLEIPAARTMADLSLDGEGRSYFQKPGFSFRFGHRGRGIRLVSPLAGSVCLAVHFWSPARNRICLRAGEGGSSGRVLLSRDFAMRPGINELTVAMRLRCGDRIVLEADHSGVFSQPLLYPLLAAAERRNIFMISADNLGADHLELYGYRRRTAPAISAFRDQAVLFRWAFANSPWTLPSHMSLFTSLHETEHQVTFRLQNEAAAGAGIEKPVVHAFPLKREKEFLVERLSRSFITSGFTGGINVAAPFGFYRGFDLYHEAPNDHLHPGSAARLFNKTKQHLLQRRLPAAFYFLHTYQVHLPYRPPPDLLEGSGLHPAAGVFDFEKDIGGIAGIFKRGDERRPADAAFLYDAEIMEFDRRFGDFIAFLKRNDLYDRAMIILLADHGEEFFEHGSWAHGTDLFNSQIRVPLLVKFPDGRYAGRRFDEPVSLMDVMPTVLAYYGIPAAPALSGRSLLTELRGGSPSPKPLFSVNLECRPWSPIPPQAVLIQGGYKLIRSFRPKSAAGDLFSAPPPVFPLYQLFHLADDPGEKRDLAAAFPKITARMKAGLQDFLDARPATDREGSQALPVDSMKILRSLGYIR